SHILILFSPLLSYHLLFYFFSFFFNDTATTEIYTLSLHDALPISALRVARAIIGGERAVRQRPRFDSLYCSTTPTPNPSPEGEGDRKSTRLNSSHDQISYAVFCLKKKKKKNK